MRIPLKKGTLIDFVSDDPIVIEAASNPVGTVTQDFYPYDSGFAMQTYHRSRRIGGVSGNGENTSEKLTQREGPGGETIEAPATHVLRGAL